MGWLVEPIQLASVLWWSDEGYTGDAYLFVAGVPCNINVVILCRLNCVGSARLLIMHYTIHALQLQPPAGPKQYCYFVDGGRRRNCG